MKRVFTVLVILFIIFLSSIVSFAGEINVEYEKIYPEGYFWEWKKEYGDTPIGAISGTVHKFYTSDGEIAFCLDSGSEVPNGNLSSIDIIEKLGKEKVEELSIISYFGYYSTDRSDYNFRQTQRYLWEIIDPDYKYVWYIPTEEHLGDEYIDTERENDYVSWKASLDSKINKFNEEKPSFSGISMELKRGESTSFSDINEVLDNWKLDEASVPEGVSVSVVGNEVSIDISKSSDTFHDREIVFSYDFGELRGNSLAYRKGEDFQDIGFFKVNKNRKISVNLSVKKEDPSKVRIIKRGEDQSLIENVVFEVYGDRDLTEKIGDYITNEKGEIFIEDLQVEDGKFLYVKEKSAPDRYVMSPDIFEIEIFPGETSEIELVNDVKKSKFKLRKIEHSTGEPIEGVVFSVFRDGELSEKLGEYTTDESGEIFIEGLSVLDGRFVYVKEKSVPDKYVMSPDTFEIEIFPGETSEIELVNHIKRSKVEVRKIDKESKKPIGGVEFEIFDSDNNLVLSGLTDENGYFSFEVDFGKYTIIEKNTPNGYKREKVKREIKVDENDQLLEIIVENEREELPKTGSTGRTIYISLISIGLGFLITRLKTLNI